jgi:hypothetical protein
LERRRLALFRDAPFRPSSTMGPSPRLASVHRIDAVLPTNIPPTLTSSIVMESTVPTPSGVVVLPLPYRGYASSPVEKRGVLL